MKLKDSTSIPLSWVFAAYIPTTTFVVAVLWWVFTVDARLERIENKLGIESHITSLALPEAQAGVRK